MPGRAQPPTLISLLPMLDLLREDHLVQEMLCKDLEGVADGLPDLPAAPEIKRLCDRILRITSTHFARAEVVFDALPDGERPAPDDLATLRGMHQMDELHGEDLVAALWQQVRARDKAGIGQLAYMLRCFFDGLRRAVALKESWISMAFRHVVKSD